MTLQLFPRLPGITFGTLIIPRFSTGISTSASGRETRHSYQAYPLWDFELSYDWLPNRREGRSHLESIVSFFLERRGSFEAFLFDAPETPLEEETLLGNGDGVTNEFILLKTVGSHVEPAGGVLNKADLQIYVDNVLTDFTLTDHRLVSFPAAPAVDSVIRGCYKPLHRVRFGEDSTQFDQFMHQLWELQQLMLKGVF